MAIVDFMDMKVGRKYKWDSPEGYCTITVQRIGASDEEGIMIFGECVYDSGEVYPEAWVFFGFEGTPLEEA